MDNLLLWMPAAVGLAGVISGGVLWILSRVFSTPQQEPDRPTERRSNTFILRDGKLVSHDISGWPGTLPFQSWDGLRDWLGGRFPDLPQSLVDIKLGKEVFCPARDANDPASIAILGFRQDGHRVTLFDPTPVSPAFRHEQTVQIDRSTSFEKAVSTAPLAMCCLDAEDKPVWQNAAFEALSEDEKRHILAETAAEDTADTKSVPEPVPEQIPATRHFDISTIRQGALTLVFAADITQKVQSETARGTFMQTLTKTFAELSIGLAVFDGNRQLVLFNPALTDLTGLRVDFLSCRPSLMDFFDRLRDNQVLPEPKSYATWRSQISGIIDSTEHGHYSESWSLPTGLTYRVTGKPHADGSVAFLIEDISDEMSLTRRYRTQLDMRQSALDHISEAVAVISPGGVVVFSNEAFSSVIGKRPDESLTEIRANTLLDACRKQFPHPSFWEEALDLVEHRKDARQLETVMACGAVCRLERLRGRFFFVGIRESRRETARARVLSA